jgi:hypothetical protein
MIQFTKNLKVLTPKNVAKLMGWIPYPDPGVKKLRISKIQATSQILLGHLSQLSLISPHSEKSNTVLLFTKHMHIAQFLHAHSI